MTRDEPVGVKAKRVLAIIREGNAQDISGIRSRYAARYKEPIAKDVVSKIWRWLTDEERATFFPNRKGI